MINITNIILIALVALALHIVLSTRRIGPGSWTWRMSMALLVCSHLVGGVR